MRETAGKVSYSRLSHELPHDVVGATLLKELGFDHTVVSAVPTHAGNAPFHGRNFRLDVPHHADCFATTP